MDAILGSFRAITAALLFICLFFSLVVNGKPLKASNRTGGYTPVQQNVRTITVGRNAFNEWNNNYNYNNIKNANNLTKVSAKSDLNSGSDMYSDSMGSDSRQSDWSLQFDPNYFESLNAANHRPVDTMIASPTDNQSKVSSTSKSFTTSYTSSSSPSTSSTSSADNTFYYSPETYGKTSHKNHKTNSFSYLYPSTPSTTTTATPEPKRSNNRLGEVSGSGTPSGYSEPAPPDTETNKSNDKSKPSLDQYSYEDTPEDEEEPNYYDTNEEVSRKYYHPNSQNARTRPKQYSVREYYGSDLSSMSTTNENSKIKSIASINTPISSGSYGPQEETDGQNIETYEGGSNVRFPPSHSKYYSGGTGAYYPSYYPSPSSYYPSSEQSFSGSDSLLHRSSSWLGPGVAGLLLGIGLPLGIMVASMIPAFMSVPGIVSTATVGRKKRFIPDLDLFSFNNTQLILNSGVLEILNKYGINSLEDPKCLTQMFCSFAAEGKTSDKNLIQNIIYHIIDWTPKQWAKWLTVDKLFNAIKLNKCETTYKCMSRKVKFKDTDRYLN